MKPSSALHFHVPERPPPMPATSAQGAQETVAICTFFMTPETAPKSWLQLIKFAVPFHLQYQYSISKTPSHAP